MSREDLAVAADLFCGDMRLVRRMHHAGVPLLAGTDTPYPFVVPGVSLHDELVLLVSAGLTSAEEVISITISDAS